MSLNEWKPAPSWGAFAFLLLIQIYVTHALGFMVHEYAHSTTAWLFGWKANPLALNYGHLSVGNLLAQLDIDESVDYAPIFADGHGVLAGVIAAAGAVIGNGLISFPVSLWGFAWARRVGSRTWAMFFYWLCVMSVGNFWDYVPVRTFAPHGDMATVAQGFGCSPWWVLVVLGLPFGVGIVYFFVRFAPRAVRWLLPESRARRCVVVLLTAAGFFGYFGMAGVSGYGAVSHWISMISACALLPLVAVVGLWETNRVRATG
jgi:hypothetical protein